MKRKTIIQILSFLLAAVLILSLISPALADTEADKETAFTNGITLADVLEVVGLNTEEATGLNVNAYVTDSTLQYFRTLINKMSSTSAYRLALEEVYGNALTVENVAKSSESIWATLNADVYENPDAYTVTRNGTSTSYANKKSMEDVLTLMKFTTTDAQYSQLMAASSPQEMFSLYSNISRQNGQGGTYVWTDTSYTGGNQTVAVGDTVLFTITASLGSKEVEGSYTQKIYPTTGKKNYEKQEKFKVVPGGSVSYSYIGTVLEVDSSGAHAAMGTVDLSGLGAVGDAYKKAMESGEQVVEPSADANGNIKFEVPAEPYWNITVSTQFAHNPVDIQAIVLSAMKLVTDEYGNVLTDSEGNPFTIDINETEFASTATRLGYFENFEDAKYAFREARTDYIVSYMENILGYPAAFSVAMATVMNHETTGYMGADSAQSNGPGRGLCQWEDANYSQNASGRYNEGVAWCNANGYDMNTIDGQLQFMNYELLYSPGYDSILPLCMTAYANDYENCVKQIVQHYERSANVVSEYYEILNGVDSQGNKYNKDSSAKAYMWLYLQEEYADVINGELQPAEKDEVPDETGKTEEIKSQSYKVKRGDTLAKIANTTYSEYITANGFFKWDKMGDYSVAQAIVDINNRYVDQHPDAGYSKITTSASGYPELIDNQTIYMPSLEEICTELGCSPNG